MTQIQMNTIIPFFTTAVNTMGMLAHTLKTPFMEPISNTVCSLLILVENVQRNKKECALLIERTYILLDAIISLHTRSETGSDLSPIMLNHLGKFTETLHKIHNFVEAQQDKSKIKHFFRQPEMSKLLKDCNAGLQNALDAFKNYETNALKDVADFQKHAEDRHQEVLTLIEALSDGTTDGSSIFVGQKNEVFSSFYNRHDSVSSQLLFLCYLLSQKYFMAGKQKLHISFSSLDRNRPG
ncbi:hypothetical protein C8R43DRAFT_958271 [Mycena crocata]|nr:hypothetical protein C8R43DRAFT_958271 [Mycena crocata]